MDSNVSGSQQESPGATPPIAVQELAERCMGNAAIAELVLAQFEKQARSDVDELAQLLQQHDIVGIGRRAHALKGAAGAVAATAVHEHAGRIEASARHAHAEAIAAQFAVLRDEVARCLSHLPAARAELAALPATNDSESAS